MVRYECKSKSTEASYEKKLYSLNIAYWPYYSPFPKGVGEFMSKQWRIALILAVAMAVSVFISACGSTSGGGTTGTTPTTAGSTAGTPGAYNCVSGTLTVSGSTALQPLADAVAKDYQKKCTGANITVGPGGSKKGLTDAESGASGIGNSDVFASSTQSDLVDHQVAVVVFALITNPSVTGVTNLTT